MSVAAWDVPFTLTSPLGTLDLNVEDAGAWYRLIPEQCDAGADLRVASDDIPQGDGAILHPGFKTGYAMKLALQLFAGGGPALGADRLTMLDTLASHLNAILRADGRLTWTPDGSVDDRILDDIRLSERLAISGGSLKTVTFGIHSRFPYVISETEDDTDVADGATETITNDGSTDTYPVIQVQGPATDFTITNANALDPDGNPLTIVYDSSRPGASSIASLHYAELDLFRQTAYLDGNGANLKAGLDPETTDFFPLVPGDNDLTIVGADMTVKSNSAWN